MAHRHALSVQELFSTAHRTEEPGIEGYKIHRNYFDPLQEIAQRELLKKKKGVKDRRHVTKRGNFIEQEQKLHKSVPGPGQYPVSSEWPEKAKLKIRYSDKKTYVDEIFKYEKKWKIPAPGHYNVQKSLKELQAEKKLLAVKKRTHQDKLTFLDDLQFRSTQTPGSGMYNPRDRMRTEYSKLRTKPEDWRKKHEEQSKKKPPKSPEVAAYSPMPANYTLFEHLNKIKKSKSQMSKTIRFKTSPIGSGLPPAKYSVLQEWRGKDKKKVAVHGFQALSKTSYKSVYYH